MERFYITKVHVNKVRHLENFDIAVTPNSGEMRHLILTGKNGSGKTSLLEALRVYLDSVSNMDNTYMAEERIDHYGSSLAKVGSGLDLDFSMPLDVIKKEFVHGNFILSYFGATRKFSSPEPKHVEKTNLKAYYPIQDDVSSKFLSYLLDMKMTQALAMAKKDSKKADEIEKWFNRLQDILRDIYDDYTLRINFDEDTFKFSLVLKDREPFDFNTASDGFMAMLDVIVDLLIRMQRKDKRVTEFLLPGIVLIDEIENHLHLELQRRVLRILTTLFPNIQFIVTTHSPFVLNSIENATIYDLENHTLIQNGLADASYSGIMEAVIKSKRSYAEILAFVKGGEPNKDE